MKSIEAEDEMQVRDLEGTVQNFYLPGTAAWFSQYTDLTVAYTGES